jgi:hypothetical protein
VPSEPSPSVSIAVSTVSIDLTAISIAVDEEGVVPPPGTEGSTGSYVVYLSLSHDVIFM